MRDTSELISASLAEAEQALNGWNIPFERRENGTLHVPGDLDISARDLTELPDLSRVSVRGRFNCGCNLLTSIETGPYDVGGDYICSNNEIASLKGVPKHANGGFYCSNNKLASLRGAPETVEGYFSCCDNLLASLEHAPRIVGTSFACSGNRLTSLRHAPARVGQAFYCHRNELTSLEYAPKVFRKLKSDFGVYTSWEKVPERLRVSPGAWARQMKEQAAAALQEPSRKVKPFRIKC